MKKSFDYTGRVKMFVCLSLAVLCFGLLMNLVFGTQMDVSFKGGTLLQYSYTGTLDVEKAETVVSDVLSLPASIQESTSGNMSIVGFSLATELSVDEQAAVEDKLTESFPDNDLTLVRANSLGASMGQKFFIKCLVALVLAALFLLIYVGIRFRKIGGLSAGAFALLALGHDLLIVYFTFVVFKIPLNDNFIAVMLTILGYSLNDTIVIYDRIRENRRKMGKDHTIAEIVNISVSQSFMRTFNTALATFIAVLTLVVVALVLNLDSIISFALPMLFGVVSGFYSSVYLSSPLWAKWIEHKEKKQAAKA